MDKTVKVSMGTVKNKIYFNMPAEMTNKVLNLQKIILKPTFDKMIAELREFAEYKNYKGTLYELFLYQDYEQQLLFMYEHGLNTPEKRKKFWEYLKEF